MMPISLYQEGVSLEPKLREQNDVKDDVNDLEKKVTIVLADDSEDLLRMLQVKLESQGYNVSCYEDKIAAIIAIKKIKEEGQELPLIISDIMSPITDGFEFLKRIKALFPEIKFMFLTAYGGAEHVKRARQMGANAYFKKPINLPVLYQGIERVLQGGDFFEVL